MRTTRVQPTPSSIFRNSRQYLHSNELFYRSMQDGSDGQNRGGNQSGKQEKKSRANNHKTKRMLKNSPKVIVKGLQFDGDASTMVCNSLLEHALKVTAARNRSVRLRTYRTSI